MSEPGVRSTPITGLLVVDLTVHGDNRGWFKENWQRQRMTALGLPDFGPVQNNVSYNAAAGVTRGIHAEPWDKLVSVATGRIFGAWVDMREGTGFGDVFTLELDPSTAVYVPRGVANSYQTLEDRTAYSYLVNDHWSPDTSYTCVNLADPAVGIDWPIPLADAEVSDKDRAHPALAEVKAVPARRTMVIGASGQVGTALCRALPAVDAPRLDELDLTDGATVASVDWGRYDTVVNAAAYTAVDEAETAAGRQAAWAANVTGLANLVRAAARHDLTVVHLSSDYVFDGSAQMHTEDEAFSPLGVYGQTKAAGDALVSTLARHYIVRTSWVIGEGDNFVRTMARLATDGVSPAVVDDQIGRLSFADDIVRGISHLLETGAAYGTYNLTSSGEPASWADIARAVFERLGRHPTDVTRVSTAEYGRGKDLAPRPSHSTLDLAKVEATGFRLRDMLPALDAYLGR